MDLFAAAVRPLLFRLDPERSHELTMGLLEVVAPLAGRLPGAPTGDGRLTQELMGLSFPNPVGLAAGFDKRASAVPIWPAVGFGFSEVGTITARAQPGNPRPRLHRLPDDRAVINRMGFNNDGADATAIRLRGWSERGLLGRAPLGVNLGKSKVTEAEDAPGDYATSLRRLWPAADYIVVNVSSPNTPGLRDLQAIGPLGDIVDALQRVNAARAGVWGRPARPVLVKIAPDLAGEDVDAVVDLARDRGLAGVIVANTTLGRPGLVSPPELAEREGGLSGAPLRSRCVELVARVAGRASGDLVVVGVGGISTADDVWDTLAAGASLVQVYTGLIYGGPAWVRALNRDLLRRMDREGVAHVSEVVGSASARVA